MKIVMSCNMCHCVIVWRFTKLFVAGFVCWAYMVSMIISHLNCCIPIGKSVLGMVSQPCSSELQGSVELSQWADSSSCGSYIWLLGLFRYNNEQIYQWTERHSPPWLQRDPRDLNDKTGITGVRGHKMSLQRLVEMWWNWAIGLVVVVECVCNCQSFSCIGDLPGSPSRSFIRI